MKRFLLPALVVSAALVVSGCTVNVSMGDDTASPSTSSSAASSESSTPLETPSGSPSEAPSESASSSDQFLNTGDVEYEIEKDLFDQIGSGSYSVTCPANISSELDYVFSCDVVSNDGETAVVEVTVTDLVGGFDWKITETGSNGNVDSEAVAELTGIYEEVWAEYTDSEVKDFCAYYKDNPTEVVEAFVNGFFDGLLEEDVSWMPTEEEVRQTWSAFVEDKCGYADLGNSGDISGGTSV